MPLSIPTPALLVFFDGIYIYIYIYACVCIYILLFCNTQHQCHTLCRANVSICESYTTSISSLQRPIQNTSTMCSSEQQNSLIGFSSNKTDINKNIHQQKTSTKKHQNKSSNHVFITKNIPSKTHHVFFDQQNYIYQISSKTCCIKQSIINHVFIKTISIMLDASKT